MTAARTAAAWAAGMIDRARSLQLALMQHQQALDDAVASHMTHGAMTGADPLTDTLYGQLEGPACEGAQAHSTAGAGLNDAQRAALDAASRDPALRWVLPLGVLGGLLLSAAAAAGWLPW